MSAFTQWITALLGMVIISALSDFIIPNGKLNNVINAIFSLATVVVLISPLPKILNGCKATQLDSVAVESVVDDDYFDYVLNAQLNVLEKRVIAELDKKGISGIQIDLSGNSSAGGVKVKSAKINLAQTVIDEKLGHINKYELVEEFVRKYFNLPDGAVEFYD